MIEIGPRLCMEPIKIFSESMGGETLWQNDKYIAPTKRRSKKYADFTRKREYKAERKEYKEKVMKEGKDPDSYLREAFKEMD